MIWDFLNSLPTRNLPTEVAVIISAFIISFAFAFGALIRNRRSLKDSEEAEGDIGTIFDNPASILPHIYELRERLIKAAIGIAVGTAVAATMAGQIFALATRPLESVGGQNALIAIGVTEPFGVVFRVSIVVGIILSSPYVITQIWIFVAAGLKSNERRIFYIFVPFAVFLFVAGVVFAYVAMLPVALPFLIQFMGFNATPTLENYIKFVTNTLLWVGVSFEMPMVMFALAKAGIVNARMLAKNWRIAIVAIAILSAVVTPTPDPINMGIVAAPLILLYVLSVILAMLA